MNTSRVVSLSLGSLVALLVVSSARAGTASYPGTQCVAINGAAAPLYEGVIARNQSSNTVNFVCGATQTGGAIASARVSVRDINPTAGPSGTVTCFARASSEFDSSGFVTASASTADGFFGNKQLVLGSTTNFHANGSKNVSCSLPPRVLMEGSGIASYAITEL